MTRLAMLPDTFWVAVVERSGARWWSGPYRGPNGQARAVVMPVPK